MPYLVADKKNLKEYHGLVSYDIQDVLISELDTNIQKKFISAAISKNKTPTNMKREFKDTYSIFYSEYKYYKDNVGSMADNVTYRDLDKYLEKQYRYARQYYRPERQYDKRNISPRYAPNYVFSSTTYSYFPA